MVDPQNPGMPHIGAQTGDERREALPAQHQRIDRRQPPILPGAVQRVGRRADRGGGRHQLLIGPGFGAVGVGADREVAIEPDRQPGGAPGGRRSAELAVGFPLQELEELDPVAMSGGEIGDLGRSRVAHRRRPIAPREPAPVAAVVLVQRLERRKIAQIASAVALKQAKLPCTVGRGGIAAAQIAAA